MTSDHNQKEIRLEGCGSQGNATGKIPLLWYKKITWKEDTFLGDVLVNKKKKTAEENYHPVETLANYIFINTHY